MKIALFCSFLVLFFTGCAPKYMIKNQYIPSRDAEFISCIQVCEKMRESCEYNFASSMKICKDAAYGRAKIAHDEELLKFEKNYRRYLRQLSIFEVDHRVWKSKREVLQKDLNYFDKNCKKDTNKYACKRIKELAEELRLHDTYQPQKPYAPRKPLFSRYLENELLMCRSENRCENNYDKCYISCGGEIIPHRMCVSNCD